MAASKRLTTKTVAAPVLNWTPKCEHSAGTWLTKNVANQRHTNHVDQTLANPSLG